MSLTLFIYACYKMNIRKFIFVIFFAQSPWIFNLNNMRYIEEMNAHVWWMRFLVKVKTWREREKKAPVTFYRFMLVTQRYIIWLTMMSNFLERFHAKKEMWKCLNISSFLSVLVLVLSGLWSIFNISLMVISAHANITHNYVHSTNSILKFLIFVDFFYYRFFTKRRHEKPKNQHFSSYFRFKHFLLNKRC